MYFIFFYISFHLSLHILGVTEEERGHLHPPTMKLSRSLSVPGPDDIPPPPEISAPEPPVPVHRRPELMHNNPTHHAQMQTRAPSIRRVSNVNEHN